MVDIVTRLRNSRSMRVVGPTGGQKKQVLVVDTLCQEAADEIERLRLAWDTAVAAERERCARLCETVDGFRDQREHGGKLAALIRRAAPADGG